MFPPLDSHPDIHPIITTDHCGHWRWVKCGGGGSWTRGGKLFFFEIFFPSKNLKNHTYTGTFFGYPKWYSQYCGQTCWYWCAMMPCESIIQNQHAMSPVGTIVINQLITRISSVVCVCGEQWLWITSQEACQSRLGSTLLSQFGAIQETPERLAIPGVFVSFHSQGSDLGFGHTRGKVCHIRISPVLSTFKLRVWLVTIWSGTQGSEPRLHPGLTITLFWTHHDFIPDFQYSILGYQWLYPGFTKTPSWTHQDSMFDSSMYEHTAQRCALEVAEVKVAMVAQLLLVPLRFSSCVADVLDVIWFSLELWMHATQCSWTHCTL